MVLYRAVPGPLFLSKPRCKMQSFSTLVTATGPQWQRLFDSDEYDGIGFQDAHVLVPTL
jgi:hypothetical protein